MASVIAWTSELSGTVSVSAKAGYQPAIALLQSGITRAPIGPVQIPPTESDLTINAPDAPQGFNILTDVTTTPGVGDGDPTIVFSIAENKHTDYHFRLWVIPRILTLSNPSIETDIPFRIWNTWSQPTPLQAVTVNGSNVLTFDYTVGQTLRVGEYREVNLQIGAGEAAIDALINFDHGAFGLAQLQLLAIVSETFPILPEVPVKETWSFKTDILVNYKGEESRLSFLEEPRISLDFNVRVVDFEERRILYDLTSSNIKVPSVVPLFQYAAPINQSTSLGSNRYFFDPALTNLRIGKTIIVMNRLTRETQLANVVELHVDGATVNAASTSDVDPGLWFAVPGISSFIENESGLDFGTQAGDFSLSARSLEVTTLQRPGSTQVVATFDGLPIIEKPFLITAPEKWNYRRTTIDNGIGVQSVRSRDNDFFLNRRVKFSIDRNTDEMDFWREFFCIVRGAQGLFLLETQLPDITLTDGHEDGAGTLLINENYYETKLFPLDAFKRFKVRYTDETASYHVVAAVSTDALLQTSASITPSLEVGKTVSRISFLHSVRASDKVSIEHFNDYSKLKFGVRTVNE